LLGQDGLVLTSTPCWRALAESVSAPWIWPEGSNGLETLRLAGRHGDAQAASAAEQIARLARTDGPDARHKIGFELQGEPVSFVWTAVAVQVPCRGVIVSAIEDAVPLRDQAVRGCCVLDCEGRLLEHDQGFARFAGGGQTELLGSPLWEVLARAGDPAMAAVLKATLPLVEGSDLEWCWAPSGIWLELRWLRRQARTRVLIAQASPTRARALQRERQRCAEREEGSQLCKQRRMEAIQRLAGGVAHDFNNRLSEIMGTAELAMAERGLGADLREAFENIVKAAQRSAVTVRQLLAFARQEASSPTTLDLNRAIEDLLRLRKELVDEKIRLTWNPGPETPLVKADAEQIHQVLEHLVSNAQEAVLQAQGGSAPEIHISTRQRIVDEQTSRRHLRVTPGLFAHIEVTDNGPGLEQQVQPRIFEPFFSTKDEPGSGLGLSTVEGIVSQHGGFVEVVSVPGRGSSFQVALPSQEDDWPEQRAPSGQAEQRFGSLGAPPEKAPSPLLAAQPGPLPTATVLVVDDEPALLRLCHRRLQRLGYRVLEALGPLAALEVARGHPGPIDVLLTDVMMPDMNGRQLSEQLSELRPETATLYMSGYAAEILAQSGALDASVHILAKPFDEAELQAKLAEVLAARPRRPPD
jgi:signal transduction histidine kinase/ActR/RegA family two-component response regulator